MLSSSSIELYEGEEMEQNVFPTSLLVRLKESIVAVEDQFRLDRIQVEESSWSGNDNAIQYVEATTALANSHNSIIDDNNDLIVLNQERFYRCFLLLWSLVLDFYNTLVWSSSSNIFLDLF